MHLLLVLLDVVVICKHLVADVALVWVLKLILSLEAFVNPKAAKRRKGGQAFRSHLVPEP